jgi:GNAT superfamily N-acetyltransferase
MTFEIGEKAIAIDGRGVVSFRPVRPEDEPFLLEVYGTTRAEELALTGWDHQQRGIFLKMQLDAQHAHYQGQYPGAEYLVILIDGAEAGRLYLAEREDEIRILDITVLPDMRGGGIGTAIIEQLKPIAGARGKDLGIYVENFNRSLGLFERLGFVRSGENGYSFLMRWSAAAAGSNR